MVTQKTLGASQATSPTIVYTCRKVKLGIQEKKQKELEDAERRKEIYILTNKTSQPTLKEVNDKSVKWPAVSKSQKKCEDSLIN